MPKTTTFGGTVCQMHCCESLPPFLSLLLSPHLSLLKCSFFVLTSLPSLVYHSVWLSQPYKYLFFCLLFHYLEKLPIVISWVYNEHWTTNKYIYRLETILYMFVIFFFLHPGYLWMLWIQDDSKWLVTWQLLCIWLPKTLAETLAIALSGSHFSIATPLNIKTKSL